MSRVLPRLAGLALTAILIILSADPSNAQSVTGSISGSVIDPSKEVVPGATVTLIDEQTSAVRTAVSGDGGRHCDR